MPALILILIVVLLLIFAPLFTIWSLNTLFGLGIAVTFKTWLCALWLSIVVGSSAVSRSK